MRRVCSRRASQMRIPRRWPRVGELGEERGVLVAAPQEVLAGDQRGPGVLAMLR